MSILFVILQQVIPKNYGKGTIHFVNAGDYFESILKQPHLNFATLSNFTSLVGIDSSDYVRKNPVNSILPIRFTGDMSVSSRSEINSSSVDFGPSDNHHGLFARQVSITDAENKGKANIILENRNISNIELVGDYEVIINAVGYTHLPFSSSFGDYVGISIPDGFNMTINLSNKSSIELISENATDDIKIVGKELHFVGVRTNQSDIASDIPIIMKRPEIMVINGKSNFDRLYVGENDPWLMNGPLGEKTELNGNLTARIDHVGAYNHRDNDNKLRTKYTTFLTLLNYEPLNDIELVPTIKIPGDISDAENIDLISKEVIVSAPSIIALLSIVSVTVVFAYLYRKKFPPRP